MQDLTNIYNKDFYLSQMNESYISASEILPYVQKYLNIKSVVDVGCGVGTWLKAWQDNKPDVEILGIDGNNMEESMFFIPTQHYKQVDLTQDSHIVLDMIRSHCATYRQIGGGDKLFDIAQSLEVAEHFDAKYAHNFIKLLTSLSDIVLFSAAIPYQGGTHHINEQPPSYWADLFRQHDYVCFDHIRMQIWQNPNISFWYRQNILLFVHKNKVSLFPNLTPTLKPNYLISPECWEYKSAELQRLKNKLIIRFSSKLKYYTKTIFKRRS